MKKISVACLRGQLRKSKYKLILMNEKWQPLQRSSLRMGLTFEHSFVFRLICRGLAVPGKKVALKCQSKPELVLTELEPCRVLF